MPRRPGVGSAAAARAASGLDHDCVQGELPVDHLSCHLGEHEVVMPGIAAQEREGFVHIGPRRLGDDAFGLLEDHPGVERHLELPGDPSRRAMNRSWRMPMVATSAIAWARAQLGVLFGLGDHHEALRLEQCL